MKDSMQSIHVRRIDEGHPPTTAEWNEFEARQGGVGPKRSRPPKGGGVRPCPPPLPMLTDEQIAANAKWIYTRLVLLLDVLDRESWDGRWNNRLMAAWLSARRTLNEAVKEKTDGVARQLGTDETETAQAAGANPADGSGRQAGEAEIHRSEGA